MPAAESDFDSAAHGHEAGRRKLFRFDPTVSSGTLLQMLVLAAGMIGAYGSYLSDKATTRMELEAVKAAAVADKTAAKEQLSQINADVKDVRTDMKEMQRTLNDMRNTMAAIQALQQRQQALPGEAAQKGRQ